MKKITNIFCLILMCFLTFGLLGCNTKDSDDSDAQKVIKEYLNIYYTIDKNDIEAYTKLMATFNEGTMLEALARTTSMAEKFKPLMTDEAYQNLIDSRMVYARITEANDNKYYLTVKNIKLEKYAEDKEKHYIVYFFDIVFTQTSIYGGKIQDVTDRRQITVFKIKDSWKIRHFDPGLVPKP